MNELTNDLLMLSKHFESCDDELKRTWKRVFEAVVTRFPPTAGGRGYNGVAQLADHLHKMGRLPLRDSRGLEMLLFRWVVAVEEMSSLLGRIVLEEGQTPAATAPMNGQVVVVDEAYQPGYCDECGGMLPPNGECFNCK